MTELLSFFAGGVSREFGYLFLTNKKNRYRDVTGRSLRQAQAHLCALKLPD